LFRWLPGTAPSPRKRGPESSSRTSSSDPGRWHSVAAQSLCPIGA
jgi:hypothetical protein